MVKMNTEVWEGLDQYGKACVSEREAGERLNDKDNDKDNGNQRNGKETREKDGSGNIEGGNRGEINKDEQQNDEEKDNKKEYLCIMCKEDVQEDGLECVCCKEWCHTDECSGVENLEEYIYKKKPYTCPVCMEKQIKKGKGENIKRRGRPPSKTSKHDLMEKHSKSVEQIESPARNKRNISEVGSPDKELTDLENQGISKNNTGSPDSKICRIEEEKPQGSDKKGGKKVEKEGKKRKRKKENNQKIG